MLLLAIDDLLLDDLGIEATTSDALLTDESQFREWSDRSRDGADGSMFFGNVPDPAIWTFVIKCPDIAAHDALFAVLTGIAAEEHRLLGQRLDVAGTRVVARAAVRAIRAINEFDLWVEFFGQDSVWTAEAPTVTTKTFTSGLDQAMPLVVPGNTETVPQIVLRPTAQRATQTAAVGYRWRRRFTVINNSAVPWYRLPLRVSLGGTTAHVSAGRAQADGDDVRLVAAGIEQERTLVTWNSGASYCWFILQNLQPGESQTYDLLSGNPAAVSPPNLAYPNLPPFRLASSSNAAWVYPSELSVANAGLGFWYLSKGTPGAIADFTVPGAWRPIRTHPNADSPDNTWQPNVVDIQTGYVWAGLQTLRYPGDALALAGRNPFDGIGISHPLGIVSITTHYLWLNPTPPIGAFVILTRNSAGEDWVRSYTDTTQQGGFLDKNAGTVTPATPVTHLAMAVWPNNFWAIDPTLGDFVTSARSGNGDTTLAINTTDLGISIEDDWTEVYELATTFRLGGGINAEPPYRELLIGNAEGEDGAGVPRATLTLTQALTIDCATYQHEVWSVSGGALVAFVEPMSAHAVAAVEGWDD